MNELPLDVLAEQASEPWFDLEQLLSGWTEAAVAFVPRFLLGLLLLALTVFAAGVVARFLRQRLEQRGVDPGLRVVLVRLTRWSLIVLGTVVALDQIDFDVTTFVTGLGVVGFTLGFAFQDISKNFVAGLLLLVQQPFRIGDFIEVAGYTGTVETIDLRATSLRTNDGNSIVIPNGDVFTSAMLNFTDLATRRVDLDVGVSYDSDLERVRQVALAAAAEIEAAHDEPPPELIFKAFGASSIDFTLRFWTRSTQREYLGARDQAIVALHRAFAREGIDIPFPIRTLQLPEGWPPAKPPSG